MPDFVIINVKVKLIYGIFAMRNIHKQFLKNYIADIHGFECSLAKEMSLI